jgi:hypothetical protein
VLGIGYRAIARHLIRKAGLTLQTADAGAGAVTPIQRFDSALNLNVHFHMLFLDGVYLTAPLQRGATAVPGPSTSWNLIFVSMRCIQVPGRQLVSAPSACGDRGRRHRRMALQPTSRHPGPSSVLILLAKSCKAWYDPSASRRCRE